MIRSCTSLVRLYHIRTTPICAVVRAHLKPTYSNSAIVLATTCDNNLVRTERNCYTRRLSQQTSNSGGASDNSGINDNANGLPVSITTTRAVDHSDLLKPKGEIKAACGEVSATDDEHDIDQMEQEDMFVDAHESFEHTKKEWGGPRRGGRLPEPTRFGDWERKGRCSDF
jgi:hypothetical protein